MKTTKRYILRGVRFSIHLFVWVSFIAVLGSSIAIADTYTITDLGTLGGTDSAAYGINSSGQVVGFSGITGDTASHAFLYSGGTMQDLGTLGGIGSRAYGINNSGQVVGSSWITGDTEDHAFLYSGGTMQDLGTLGGRISEAVGINNSGQVVGWSFITGITGDPEYHAFLYSGGTMQDLNDLIPSSSGWMLYFANGINDVGQIVGWGTINGVRHGFLLTPTTYVYTASGSNVTVSPPGGGTTITFSNISSSGYTSVTTSSSGPAPPAGFQLGNPPIYYKITTTATYTPPVTVCVNYNPAQYSDPSAAQLFHYENSAWVNITTSNDVTNHIICGQVNTLSPFAIFEATSYTVTASIAGDSSGGSVSPSSQTVSYGAAATFTVTTNTGYTATVSEGTLSGSTWTIPNVTSTHTVTVTFTKNTWTVTPPAHNFDYVKVKKSKAASFVVKNSGKTKLSILSSTITGPDASMFKITSGGGSKIIKPGKTLTIKVAFKPTSKGSKNATLEITSNDPVTPTIDIPLSGTGQ